MGAIPAGARVLVRAHNAPPWLTGPPLGLHYGSFRGVLLEPCNGEGWDVVDVRAVSGRVRSVYSFSVERSV